MASQHRTTRKERLQRQKKALKQNMRNRMDDSVWSKFDKAVDLVRRFIDFEYEYANAGPHMASLLSIMFGLGHMFGIGKVPRSSEPFGLPFWAVYAGVFLWGYSHNDEGRKIIQKKVEGFFGNYVKPKAKVAGSRMLSLASTVGKVLPAPGYRTMNWFFRIFNLGVLGTAAYFSYMLYPDVGQMVLRLAPIAALELTHAYTLVLTTMPVTIAFMMLYTFDRLTLRWGRRRWKLGAAMLLGSVQFLVAFQLLFTGLL